MVLRGLYFAIALVLLPLFHISAAHAAEPLGSILEIEGAGTVSRAGAAAVPVKIDDPLYNGDTIEAVGANSRLLIMLIDGSEITISDDAAFRIDEFAYAPADPEINAGRFTALKGSFLFVSGLVSKIRDPDVRIDTTYGAIGLRGTTVWGGPLDEEYGVLVQDGEVDFANTAGTVRVSKGQGTFVQDRTRPPKPPAMWREEKRDRALARMRMKRGEVIIAKRAEYRRRHPEMVRKYDAAMKDDFARRRAAINERLNKNRRQQQDLTPQQREKLQNMREKRTEQIQKMKENGRPVRKRPAAGEKTAP